MKTRVLAASLLALSAAAGCARDPAMDAPKASVTSTSTPTPEPTAPVPVASIGAAATAVPTPKKAAAGKGEVLPIDPAQSKLAWIGSKVTRVHEGRFDTFSGAITLVDGKPEKSQVVVEIDVDSIQTDSKLLVGHLKSGEFFDAAGFPKATFTSTAITANAAGGATHVVRGALTMRGVTKEIAFPATISVEPGKVTAKAKFSINRQDWGVAYKGAADDLIRDDVVVDWSIVARSAG